MLHSISPLLIIDTLLYFYTSLQNLISLCFYISKTSFKLLILERRLIFDKISLPPKNVFLYFLQVYLYKYTYINYIISKFCTFYPRKNTGNFEKIKLFFFNTKNLLNVYPIKRFNINMKLFLIQYKVYVLNFECLELLFCSVALAKFIVIPRQYRICKYTYYCSNSQT